MSEKRWTEKYRCGECGGLHCYWCGWGVEYRESVAVDETDRMATREHLVPRSQGGGEGENVVLACKRCNVTRNVDASWLWYHHGMHGTTAMPPSQRTALDIEGVTVLQTIRKKRR